MTDIEEAVARVKRQIAEAKDGAFGTTYVTAQDASTILLARVEAGSGADRELDAEISAAFYQPKDWRPTCRPSSRRGFIVISYVDRDGRRTSGTQRAPAYTTDLNAVIALVEAKRPDANCHGYDKDPKGVTGYVSRNCVAEGHWLFEGHHATEPARALLAALLRAEMEKQP